MARAGRKPTTCLPRLTQPPNVTHTHILDLHTLANKPSSVESDVFTVSHLRSYQPRCVLSYNPIRTKTTSTALSYAFRVFLSSPHDAIELRMSLFKSTVFGRDSVSKPFREPQNSALTSYYFLFVVLMVVFKLDFSTNFIHEVRYFVSRLLFSYENNCFV